VCHKHAAQWQVSSVNINGNFSRSASTTSQRHCTPAVTTCVADSYRKSNCPVWTNSTYRIQLHNQTRNEHSDTAHCKPRATPPHPPPKKNYPLALPTHYRSGHNKLSSLLMTETVGSSVTSLNIYLVHVAISHTSCHENP
jgi:hypothetical protein